MIMVYDRDMTYTELPNTPVPCAYCGRDIKFDEETECYMDSRNSFMCNGSAYEGQAHDEIAIGR